MLEKRTDTSSTRNSALVAFTGGCVYGYTTGIIAGIAEPIVHDFFPHADLDKQSMLIGLLTASILIGGVFGTFISVVVAEKWGLKRSLAACGVIGAIGSVILATVPHYAVLVIARAVVGLAVGFTCTLCPLYVTKVAKPELRGRIGTLFQIGICASILVAEVVNYLFSRDNQHIERWKWQLQFGFGAIPCVVLCAYSLSFLAQEPVETRPEVAPAPLTTAAVQPEQMPAADYATTQQGWTALFSRAGFWWVCLAIVLAAAGQITGINALIFYAPRIFRDAGFSNPLILTFTLVGLWNLVAVFISFAFVDKLGRRPLMLFALFLMAIASGLLALAYTAFPQHKGPAAIASVVLFIGGFESFPMNVKGAGLSFANIASWCFNILVSFGFPVANQLAGPAITFFVFFLLAVICLCLLAAMLQETKHVHDSEAPSASDAFTTTGKRASYGSNTNTDQPKRVEPSQTNAASASHVTEGFTERFTAMHRRLSDAMEPLSDDEEERRVQEALRQLVEPRDFEEPSEAAEPSEPNYVNAPSSAEQGSHRVSA